MAASSQARGHFGRALVSALDCARTVKLAAAVPEVHAHLRRVDSGRVAAAVKEHRVQAFLDGVPTVMVQGGVVTAWAILFVSLFLLLGLGTLGTVLSALVQGAVLHLVMVFRGHLFAALDGTSHRQRMYRLRST